MKTQNTVWRSMNTSSTPCSYNSFSFIYQKIDLRLDRLMESKNLRPQKKAKHVTHRITDGRRRNASRIEKKKTNHISLKLKLISTLSTGWTCETIDVFIPAPYAFWWLPISSIFSCPFPFFHLIFNSFFNSLLRNSGWCQGYFLLHHRSSDRETFHRARQLNQNIFSFIQTFNFRTRNMGKIIITRSGGFSVWRSNGS